MDRPSVVSLQFAFTVSFHIIFPSFTIGLAAGLTVLEAFYLITGMPVYRRLFEFWLKIFGVTFGLGVVSGIVLAFEFGMNWSRLSEATGPIQGPLLTYESFTAFALEASFFGVLIFGRTRVPPAVYLLSTAWSLWERRSAPSGSWSTIAGCRLPSAMRSKMASSFQRIGRRSFSARSYGLDFLTCSWRPI